MAKDLNVTPAFLSATETGRKPVPRDMLNKVILLLNLSMPERNELTHAADTSRRSYQVRLTPQASGSDREVAAMFARQFTGLSDEKKEEIRKILEGRGS
jgi:hypothetical protein